MITIKEIKENIKCPQFGDISYGKWGALKIEQRVAYKQLIEEVESADNVIKSQYKEIERLNNDIKILLQENGNKEKVIKAQDNIIKEVKEYIEENLCYSTCDGMKYTIPSGKDILEILDKVGVDKK